jgi:serine phosphatase RsbU (regulator of sigma subunit)/anti-sigma regulatory factor (Ser/Thr protein kinase)
MLTGTGGHHLRSRIITWSFLPAMLVLAIVAVVTYLAYERVAEEEIIGRERERAYFAVNRLREEMSKFSEELEVLARTEALYRGHPLGQRASLAAASRRLAVFDGGVALLNTYGRVIGSEPEREEIFQQDWSDREYFRRLLTGESVVFSDVLHDGPGNTPVVVVAVPITSTRGEFLGALAGMFRLGDPTISALYASLVRLRVGNNLYLVDSSGQIIYHQDSDRIGQQFSIGESLKSSLNGLGGAYRATGASAEDAVIAYAPVPGTPWGLVTESDWSGLVSATRSYGRFLLALLVLGIVLPAGGFALLARARRAEAAERAYLEQQLQVARLIQQTLLPREAPNLPGWRLSGHYQPAQAVGGDFYDFLRFDDGRLGLIVGDVTDKGMPAALLMATTRSLLRTVAAQVQSPGEVLRRVNDLLGREIPPKMFVTCLYAVLDPATGWLQYANAGHNLPYRAHSDNGKVGELWARGMPLGLMPDMHYEEIETTIRPGECVLFYSDGLVEAHSPRREMFGNERLQRTMGNCAGECPGLIQQLLADLQAFTGKGWQQEDDVTLVTLQRTGPEDADGGATTKGEGSWSSLTHFTLASEPGNERQAIQEVAEAVRALGLPPARVDRLKTAVAEATMNAIEHGNQYRPDLRVGIHVLASEGAVAVRVTDRGSGQSIPEPQRPDLEAKLAGLQSPRGWGLFLIENMVDQVNVTKEEDQHTVELILSRRGGDHASQSAEN